MTLRKQCSVEKCIQPATKKGYCESHYRKLGNPRKCSLDGCNEPHAAKGYCQVHYKKMKRDGILKLESEKGCSIEGCDRPHLSGGYCKLHYERIKKTGSHEDPINKIRLCEVDGCSSPVKAKNMCGMHYRRFSKFGDPNTIKKEWKSDHGLVGSRVYRIWSGMKTRCYLKSSRGYKWYGAKGITVCDEWLNSFEKFYEDMGDPPTNKHQIDRIDNDKGYNKENCRWVLSFQNNRNRRSTKLTEDAVAEIRSSTLSNSQLSTKYEVSISYVSKIRNNRRWNIQSRGN